MLNQALRLVLLAVLVTILSTACRGTADDVPSSTASMQRFPDVTKVTVQRTGETFTVTIRSPYDTPERYADGWRVKGEGGTVYGKHTLAHDHADEQPFTRTQTGVRVPAHVEKVIVEARDKTYGFGGATKTVTLPG